MAEHIGIDFARIAISGVAEPTTRAVAVERPVAIEFNGIGYAVMMATPADLDDFVTGFAFAERLVTHAGQILDVDHVEHSEGELVRVTLVADRVAAVAERARHRIGESSCGICGIENLEQAIRPLPQAAGNSRASTEAIFQALSDLSAHQPLNRVTGAVHAAACCTAAGRLIAVREDVGRHNAFDKLIGAMLCADVDWDGGFALLTSRCSYELVEKAALAGCPHLVSISAPTSLAVERARACGLRLTVLARADALLELVP